MIAMSCILYNFAIEPLAQRIRNSKLKGIKIPGKIHRLIVNLFADDTLVYLHQQDKLEDLREIIDVFCKASTARFNQQKTEYLPVGEKKYRDKVTKERKVGGKIIETTASLIKDGQAMRTLGAWVGNNVDPAAQWDNVLESQRKVLKAWRSAHLSYRGKELVLKALAQSKAMFLATVNGMPKDVEEKMTRMFKDFVWDGKPRGLMQWKAAVAPRNKGGLNMPDVKSRLEAIQTMWIKKWLAPEGKRPTWAFIMDEILKKNIAKNPVIHPEATMNWALQSWHESESKDAKISSGIRNLLKTARKFNLEFIAQRISTETKKKLPFWHNIEVNNNYLWNKKAAKCLRDKCNVRTVGDLVQLMEEDILPCGDAACKRMVPKLIDALPDIINPVKTTPKKIRQQNLDLTPKRLEENKESQQVVVFNPDVRAKGNPMDHIRIFATPMGAKTRRMPKIPRQPAYRPTNARYNYENRERPTTLWLFAIAHRSGYENGDARAGEFFGKRDPRNRMFRIPQGEQSKGRAEVFALARALAKYPEGDLKVITKSERLFLMFKNEAYRSKEDLKWSGAKCEKEWRTLLQILRNRQGVTQIELVTPENAQDTQIIKEEGNKLREMKPEELDTAQELSPPTVDYEVRGARLAKMTQKLAYELALKKNMVDPRTPTIEERLTFVKQEVERVTTYRPTSEMIWMSIEKINPPRVSDFVWKILTDRLKCGSWFARIPGWEDKQYCACSNDQLETIEHIMYECERNHTNEVWTRIGCLWEQATETPFVKPNTGIFVGIETIKLKGRNTKMYRNLVTIGSWAIWKKRNERIFQKRATTLKETLSLIGDLITDQIEQDLDWSKDQKVKAKEIKMLNKVLDTWDGGGVFIKETPQQGPKIRENIRTKIASIPRTQKTQGSLTSYP